MRTGEWLRGRTEHCLLAPRGKPVFLHGRHSTVLHAARREHSRKPEEFYGMVEATCPGSKLELLVVAVSKGLAYTLKVCIVAIEALSVRRSL
jgi:N6-adenosine-specific RNA methylase IME4